MKSLTLASFLFVASQIVLSAQIITTSNIFNDGTTQATVLTDSAYSTGAFPYSNIDNLSGSGEFVFGDYARFSDPPVNPSVNDQRMSITGFSDPTGIGSLRFFDGANYEVGRVATQVTIYYSKSAATGNSLNLSDYHVLNGGVAYTLSADLNSNNGYQDGTDVATGINYDELTGLSIPIGTKSILLDFGAERDGYNASTYFTGAGFAEIQAFGDAVVVPEPSTWAMMFAGLAFLGVCIRRKSGSAKA
jgi:hypothetical protein